MINDETMIQAVPEKFRDPETGEIRVDALVASYLELEKKLSGMIPRPESEDDKIGLLKQLGMPETPDEYDVKCDHGLFCADPEVNQRLHARGFTMEQVQEVYDLAAEKFVPMILDLAGEFQADREIERLMSAFGGEEKWKEVSRQLLAFGQKNLPPQVLESLSSSFDGVMALYRMMKGQEPGVAVFAEETGMANEQDLQAMMRDPRYWKERDPSFVAKVTEGFTRIYGS